MAILGDLPIRFIWYFNGNRLIEGHLDNLKILQVDEFTSSLSFVMLSTQHSGNYTCEATNAASTAERSSAQLVVNGNLIF
jgi:hypothetical protein